jgi:hypothetical protein
MNDTTKTTNKADLVRLSDIAKLYEDMTTEAQKQLFVDAGLNILAYGSYCSQFRNPAGVPVLPGAGTTIAQPQDRGERLTYLKYLVDWLPDGTAIDAMIKAVIMLVESQILSTQNNDDRPIARIFAMTTDQEKSEIVDLLLDKVLPHAE